ncbi:MAG: amino acid permease [Gammaproteobacteria bacterium]|nr:MAG: amino acid permease [Gammaproteobacteria bacterium]TLZ59784.1 MAG: amino acid permease [Gammaproteobacteria bacterium]
MADQWGERMPRSVSLLQTVAVSVGIAIGSGIFRVPATVAAQLHTSGPILSCWVLGGVIALCGTLTVAELAAALPRSGGIFAYLLESYGPLPAFLFGWTELVVIRAAALGAIATVFAEYIGYFVPLSAAQVRYLAAFAIVLIGGINHIGVQRAAAVQSVTTVLKYGVLAALGLLAFTATGGSTKHFTPAWPAGAMLSPLASALIPVLWTYDGWADPATMGGEISNPQRNLPIALIAGALCVMLVYLVVNIGFLYALAPAEMAGSKLIASSVAARIPLLGGAGAAVVAAAVVVSAFSGLNASMMTGSRVFFAMADRGLFLRAAARVSPQFNTPSVAIWLASALGVGYVLENDFAQLADKFILGIWPFYALTVGGVFMLRRRRPELPRPYRVFGYPFVPALFLLASALMVLNALLTDPGNTAVTLLIIVAGVPAYWLRGRLWPRHSTGSWQ